MKQIAPLILSGLALAVASAAYVHVRTAAKTAPPPPAATIAPGAPVRPPAPPPPPTPESDSDPAAARAAADNYRQDDNAELLLEVQDRLFDLEKTLSQMRGGWEGLARRGLVPLMEDDMKNLQQQAADPGLPIGERLSAVSLLRRHNAMSDVVIGSLIQMLQTTTNPKEREQILSHMDGLDHPALQAPLLAVLGQEQDPVVRARAADALSAFSADPTAQTLLRQLAEQDPDERVRREARQAAYERLDRMEPAALEQIVMGSQAPVGEKLEALGRLRQKGAPSPQVVTAMLGLYQGSTDSNLRTDVFRRLDGVADPSLKLPALQALAGEENPRLREEAADILSSFHKDPDVAAWLKHLSANDPDSRVRQEAQAALKGQEAQWGR